MTTTRRLAPLLLPLVIMVGVASGQDGPLVQPRVIESSGGLLDVELAIEYADHTSGMGTLFDTRLLDGTMPGPTLRVRPGDTMRILYRNDLEDQGLGEHEENGFGRPDTTNLHFHGAHVSGELPSDDVTMSIEPQDEYQYVTVFPDEHMPGTHWIHPHVHGSGSIQVGGGAAMALIVEDAPGSLPPAVEDADDVLLLVQHVDVGELERVRNESGDSKLIIDHEGDYLLVNGQHLPTVSMRPGEWQRWRVAYAGWLEPPLDFEFAADGGDNCEMQLLAKDGVYVSDFPRRVARAPIPTAGRADLMVRCGRAGTFGVAAHGGPLLTVEVAGEPVVESPDALPPIDWGGALAVPEYLESMTETVVDPDCSCTTRLGGQGGAGNVVNGRLFDANVYLHTVVLGSPVERRLTGVQRHPYHQHVYPFQIVGGLAFNAGVDGYEHDEAYFRVGDWHDVLYVSSEDGSVDVRYNPTIHLGKLMLHCHRLNHEDTGMMAQEDVLDPGTGTCQCDANVERAPTEDPAEDPTDAPTTGPSLRGTTQVPTAEPTAEQAEPTPEPTVEPTAEPTANEDPPQCADDDGWTTVDRRGRTRDCAFVSGDPGRHCQRLEGATENCRLSCGSC